MRLEEYILKRKTEDGINEFDRDKRAENTRICVNYIFEYFNNYLETTAGEEKTILHDEKIEKYARMVEQYSGDIQEWLIDLYSSYGKYLHRTLPGFIKDTYFLLYDSEAEFRALSYDIYPKIIKKYKFLEGHSEMIYRFIKDEHRVRSMVPEEGMFPNITESINEWMSKTYLKKGVNIYSFCSEYLFDFMENPDAWPRAHKGKSQHIEEFSDYNGKFKVPVSMLYDYDYRQKNNLFGLDMLYRKMPKKDFIKGKKQELEAVLMYCYCNEWDSQLQYWEEYIGKLLL